MKIPFYNIPNLRSNAPWILLPALILSSAWARSADSDVTNKAQEQQFDSQIQPALQKYCYPCHNGTKVSGGVNLADFKTVVTLQKDQATWRKVVTQLRARSMPPAGSPAPDNTLRETIANWLHTTLETTTNTAVAKNPGRILVHRLNRSEYNNTIRDLLGVNSNPADKFPADGSGGGGFDNNADTLFLPPILMERYLEAAGSILDEVKPSRLLIVKPGKGVTETAAAKRILSHYTALAFRRPSAPSESDRLLSLYTHSRKQGESFEESVKFAMKGVLVNPNFLFRIETNKASKEAYPIGDYELASRLSYFLWSSMPDNELFKQASKNTLHLPDVLDSEVKRMLHSPKSRDFAESFAGQWLRVKELYTSAQPDTGKFPAFTPTIRDAMFQESIDFFHSLLTEDAGLTQMINADYTFLNEDLAKYYGIEGVSGKEFRRVQLTDKRRGGILTQGAVLTLTSYPQRTSPVLRGKWVLENILGSPPPPPPQVVAVLSTDDAPVKGETFRQRLEKHRSKPECASCHARMDPIGFGLENYDPIGRWRSEIGGIKVDSSGVFNTGEKFDGPVELKRILLTRRKEFIRNFTEKMLSYSLGRGLEPYDLPTEQSISAAVEKDDRMSTLIREIVKSYPFRYRKNLSP